MRIKVAIIDPLGAHGSSHHFYLFGQAKGLTGNDVSVSLYTNNETDNPRIDGVFLPLTLNFARHSRQ